MTRTRTRTRRLEGEGRRAYNEVDEEENTPTSTTDAP